MGLEFIAMATTRRTDLSTHKTSTERRYFIGSDARASVETIAGQVRGHWGIENSLHWVLDMAFNEDQARHRAGNCAQNLATLRHFAINLLKNEPTSKLGVANKRRQAGWAVFGNSCTLLSVLTAGRDGALVPDRA